MPSSSGDGRGLLTNLTGIREATRLFAAFTVLLVAAAPALLPHRQHKSRATSGQA